MNQPDRMLMNQRSRLARFCTVFLITLTVSMMLGRAHDFAKNCDVAWYLHVADRVVQGETLYRDIIEINPPLIIWFNVIPILVADGTGLNDFAAFQLFTSVLISISAAGSHLLLCRLYPQSARTQWWAMTVLLFCLLCMPGILVFGEREHLFLIFFLPYFFMTCCRILVNDPPIASRIAAGSWAGIGVALKPHFALTVLLFEAYVLSQRRKLMGRWEFAVIAMIGSIYLVVVWLLIPQYFELVHAAAKSYQGFVRTEYVVLLMNHSLLAIVVLAVCQWLVGSAAPVSDAVSRAGLMLGITLFGMAVFQGKGFGYHYYPSLAIGVLSLSLLLPESLHCKHWRQAAAVGAIVGVLGQVIIASCSPVDERKLGSQHLPQLRDIVLNQTQSDDSIFVMSVDMAPAIPLVAETGRSWAGRFPSLWPLWSAYCNRADQLGMTVEQAVNSGVTLNLHTDLHDDFTREFCDAVVVDLVRYRPKLILVQRSFRYHAYEDVIDFVEFFAADPRFDRLMDDYNAVGVIGDFELFERTE